MKKIVLFIVVICFTSCWKLNRPDYSKQESFQIGNTLSEEVTLHFYENDSCKIVYYKIYEQSSPVLLTSRNKDVPVRTISKDTIVTIKPNHTLLLYAYTPKWDYYNASCLGNCGSDRLYLFCQLKQFMGDSVTISYNGGANTSLPILDLESWETWYNESEYIYYHYWRID
jgi:hypothetical protein